MSAQHAKPKPHPVAVGVVLILMVVVLPLALVALGSVGLMLGILTAWLGRGLTKI